MDKNIIITGGTGFLGSNLVDIFSRKYKVYNLGRSRNERCENIYWSLKDNLEIRKIPQSIDTIIHCASIVGDSNYDNNDYMEVNTISTLKLLELCVKRGVKQFVYISTGGVYGFSKDPFSEENQCNPQGIYSISKYFSEKLCIDYSEKITITILRFFFPYGKGQQGRLISKLINQIKNGETIILNNDGMPLINPIHITDACNIIKGVVDKRIEGVFNVSGNEIISIKELCDIIGKKIQIKNIQFSYNGKGTENMMGNNGKILRALDYSIKTTISDGVEKIINT